MAGNEGYVEALFRQRLQFGEGPPSDAVLGLTSPPSFYINTNVSPPQLYFSSLNHWFLAGDGTPPPTIPALGSVALASYGTAAVDAPVTIGGCVFDPADYTADDVPPVLMVVMWGRVTRDGLTGVVLLTDRVSGTTLTVAAITETERTVKAAVIPTPLTTAIYELQLFVNGAVDPADYAVVAGAMIRVTRS